MKLHHHAEEFESILLIVAERNKIRPDVLEKDYYVTLLLQELSLNQVEWKAYFKGGTALYKALSSINRFSEDIDLTVSIEDCSSRTQEQKRVERSAKGYSALERLTEDKENYNGRGNVTSIYGYPAVFKDNVTVDPLQRFGRVKIEATSFTVSEPVEMMEIAPAIYTYSKPEEKEILKKIYEVRPFGLLTIKLERIFVDKVFATEFYYERYKNSKDVHERRQFAFDVAKHIYDLMILSSNVRIISLLSNPSYLNELISLKRTEERNRRGGINSDTLIREFTYLNGLLHDSEFGDEYSKMQDIYVFNDLDKMPLSDAKYVMELISSIDG